MKRNVLDYEPKQAIFVDNNNPLLKNIFENFGDLYFNDCERIVPFPIAEYNSPLIYVEKYLILLL